MLEEATSKLSDLIIEYTDRLNNISELHFSAKPSPEKWSKKEILGHLIDSANNNHQRFIRVQFEHQPTIFYDQDLWVYHNHYKEIPSKQLVALWTQYNTHLLEVIKRIPSENLLKECRMRDGRLVTLDFLVNDYVGHLEHHLRQIIN